MITSKMIKKQQKYKTIASHIENTLDYNCQIRTIVDENGKIVSGSSMSIIEYKDKRNKKSGLHKTKRIIINKRKRK